MAEGRQRHEWAIASNVMALIANSQRDRKRTRPFRASDFDPFARPRRPIRADVSVLKDVFIDGRMPRMDGVVQEASP